MFALLPLVGGILLARFLGSRSTVVGVEIAFFAIAAAVLIATAPDHGHGYGAGVLLSVVLAPLCALAVVLGTVWRNRSARTETLTS
jgi:ribose/xylose/arabinose/galactoside ABC-type transport system permease subunit